MRSRRVRRRHGRRAPSAGADLKPLGDGFVALVKMFIAPITFCTVVHGIASMGNARAAGRVSLKALVYFEVLTTVAMVIGLVVVNVVTPGSAPDTESRGADVAESAAAAGRASTAVSSAPAVRAGRTARSLTR